MTHFADADDPSKGTTQKQISIFNEVTYNNWRGSMRAMCLGNSGCPVSAQHHNCAYRWPLVANAKMDNKNAILKKIEFHPLTYERWPDFELLFGEKGACGGCWCMWWRLKRSEFEKQKGKGNKQMMKKLIKSGEIPGIIAYYDNQPVGWCSISPRERFYALERSRILKRIDDKPVWSVVCFFIAKPYIETFKVIPPIQPSRA